MSRNAPPFKIQLEQARTLAAADAVPDRSPGPPVARSQTTRALTPREQGPGLRAEDAHRDSGSNGSPRTPLTPLQPHFTASFGLHPSPAQCAASDTETLAMKDVVEQYRESSPIIEDTDQSHASYGTSSNYRRSSSSRDFEMQPRETLIHVTSKPVSDLPSERGRTHFNDWLEERFNFDFVIGVVQVVLALAGVPMVFSKRFTREISAWGLSPVWRRLSWFLLIWNGLCLVGALVHTGMWFLAVREGHYTALFLSHLMFCFLPLLHFGFGLFKLSHLFVSGDCDTPMEAVLRDIRSMTKHIAVDQNHIHQRLYRSWAGLFLIGFPYLVFKFLQLTRTLCSADSGNTLLSWNIFATALNVLSLYTFAYAPLVVLSVWMMLSKVLICLTHTFLSNFRSGRYSIYEATFIHFRLSQCVARTANLFQFVVIGGMGLAVFQGLLHAFVLIAESAELKDRCVAINYLEFVGQNAVWFIVQSWALLQAAMLSAQLSRTVDVANALYACELLTRHHVSTRARSPAHLPDVPESEEPEAPRAVRMPSLRNLTAQAGPGTVQPLPPASVPRASSAPSAPEPSNAGELQPRISPPKKPQPRPHVLGQKRPGHAPLYLGLSGGPAKGPSASRAPSNDQCSVYNFNACPPALQQFISMHEEGQAPLPALGSRDLPSYLPRPGQRLTTRGDLASDLHRPLLPDSDPSDLEDRSEHSADTRAESGHDWAFGAPAYFGPISESNGGDLNWTVATGRSSPHALSPEQSMSCLLSPHDVSIHNSWQAFLLYLTARSSQGVVMFGVTVDLQLLYRMIAVAVPVGLVAAQRYLGSFSTEE